MKLSDYLKSRMPSYLVCLVAFLSSVYVLALFDVAKENIIIVCVIMVLGFLITEIYEILRRKRFYDRLTMCLEELDKKYLLAEMLDVPEFYDGRILHEALKESEKSMNDTVAEYRRDNTAFREYIELWVHEIKLPVASLRLMCHNDGNQKYLEQLGRIDDYIENVLYYARSNSAEKDYLIKKTSIKKTFVEVAVRYRTELQSNNINLQTEGLDKYVMTDSKWLTYMLSQIMANSIKYISSERQPEIKVSAEELDDRIVLNFRDNGIGVSETDLPHIFDKSFTGENGRLRSQSTGMGLYLVKSLCDKLGHTISADSVKGEYMEVRISFGKDKMHDLTEM